MGNGQSRTNILNRFIAVLSFEYKLKQMKGLGFSEYVYTDVCAMVKNSEPKEV